MTQKRFFWGTIALLFLLMAIPPIRWGCYWTGRYKAYQYLSTLYGEHISMDRYGRFLTRLNLDSDTPHLYIEHIGPSQIKNDAGVTAEVTYVSAEDNVLALIYRNDTLENASVSISCRSVEKWIDGGWYNVTYYYRSGSKQLPLKFGEETTRTLRLCAEFDPETGLPYSSATLSAGLTRADAGRYRLILPVYTDTPLDSYTDKDQNHFYITAEFEIP